MHSLDGPARYHRQSILPGIGADGQAAIRAGRVALVGCGALGTVIADHLVRAGVGTLVVIDRDIVEATNLQRQTLYTEDDARAGRPKAEAAAAALARVNHEVRLEPHVRDLRSTNARTLLADADVIVDGLDSFETRYLLNDVAVAEGRPYVYGGAVGTGGLSLVILPETGARVGRWTSTQSTPCLRCLFGEPPAPGGHPTCDTAGILAPVSATVAARQAAETLKLLAGRLDAVDRRLVSFDLWDGTHRAVDVSGARRDDCPCCGTHRFEWLDGRGETDAEVVCGREAVQVRPAAPDGLEPNVDLPGIADRLRTGGEVTVTEHLIRGHLGGEHAHVEITLFRDGRALLRGVRDPEQGRKLYARYVGC